MMKTKWTAIVDDRAEKTLTRFPADITAKILHIVELLVEFEPQNVGMPHVRPVTGQKKLWEIRAKGKDGIARLFYFTMSSRQIVLLHGFMKKTQKTPQGEIDTAVSRMKEYTEAKKK
jgi:phage-related protein